jgi:altered-inheritance-of-mitochondria protein 5
VLTNIIEPQPPASPPTTRLDRAGILETVKDRWNGELERAVRNVYGTDWRKVREETEDRVRGLVGRLREKGEEVKKDI